MIRWTHSLASPAVLSCQVRLASFRKCPLNRWWTTGYGNGLINYIHSVQGGRQFGIINLLIKCATKYDHRIKSISQTLIRTKLPNQHQGFATYIHQTEAAVLTRTQLNPPQSNRPRQRRPTCVQLAIPAEPHRLQDQHTS